MRRIFFTSDTHFGHGNIIKYCHRPFLTDLEQELLKGHTDRRISAEAVKRMDAVLIDQINALVGPDDVLWHLGDWSYAIRGNYYAACRAYRDRIACRTIHIVWGNHDRPLIRDLFQEAHEQAVIQVDGQKIVLNHYAMAVWPGNHRGVWHLYGHSHSTAEAWLDGHMPGRRSFDVGVDNAARLLGKYRPWSFEEIAARMRDRPGFALDHHDPHRRAEPSVVPGKDS